MSQHTPLTPQEQIRLVNGGSFFGTAGIPEQDIPRMQFLDGGTGMNFEQLFGDLLSHAGYGGIGSDPLRAVLRYFYTPEQLPEGDARRLYDWIVARLQERFPAMTPPGCYPPGMLLGATWNPETVYAVGAALGSEARAYGVHVLLGTPNVNLHRDPRNGRLFEGYSEDPCLAATLAPEMVKGVQSQGVAANVKHFAANHQETNRMGVDEHIPDRALQELYYPGFRACVDAGVATVMSAYNKINGVACTENSALLEDTLREEWGFTGLVMSDWGAVYHPAAAVNAGNDLAMPGPIGPEVLTKAYEDGSLSKAALARSAERAAKLARTYALPASGGFSVEGTDKAAYDAAAEGIVLLKNDRRTLPLSTDARVALFGEHAAQPLTCGEGSAGILTTRNASLLNALSTRFAAAKLDDAADADVLVYVYSLEGREGNDRKDLSVPAAVQAEWDVLLAEAERTGSRCVLVLNVSGPVVLDAYAERFDAILCLFLPGMQGANALADILCGKVNPSGKLPLTFPKRMEDMPTFLQFPGDGMQVQYGEGIFVGYRWYDTRKIEPLYPFGHGLSYTTFAVTAMTAETETFTDCVTVRVQVKNTGDTAGKTVVQLYVSDEQSTLCKPVKELKAFQKVYLAAGEEQELVFQLDAHAFESFDPNLGIWTLEEGFYTLTAGFSARDLQASCRVYADVRSPYAYGPQTSVKTIMEDEELLSHTQHFFVNYHLPWSAMLTSYEYTAQDTIGQILEQVGCTLSAQLQLYDAFETVRKP